MPLAEPPVASGSLNNVPAESLAGAVVHRVWRRSNPEGVARPDPWWFASAPGNADRGGRFDLSTPMGTCYLATRPVGAVLEALQAHLLALPLDELRSRRLARIVAPGDAPSAARLTAAALAGRHGVTAALWAGGDRGMTQRWATAFRRDGWWALYSGLQHDPSGRLRGFALFDHAGAHPPSMGRRWTVEGFDPSEDTELHRDLASFGIEVREPGDLPFMEHPSPPR